MNIEHLLKKLEGYQIQIERDPNKLALDYVNRTTSLCCIYIQELENLSTYLNVKKLQTKKNLNTTKTQAKIYKSAKDNDNYNKTLLEIDDRAGEYELYDVALQALQDKITTLKTILITVKHQWANVISDRESEKGIALIPNEVSERAEAREKSGEDELSFLKNL